MNEKMRHVLGFLGLVEDEYGDNSASGSARPFSEQPLFDNEPEYSPPPVNNAARPLPTIASNSGTRTPLAPLRISSISVLDASGQGPRVRPMASAGPRGINASSQERDIAIFFPSTYHESRRITDMLRSNRASSC